MPVTIEVGDGQASIDVATTEDLTKHFADLYDWMLTTTSREELAVELGTGKTTPAAALTYTYLDLGFPKPGWFWDVMRLEVHGNDPSAVVAGNVWAYITGRVPQDSATILDAYPQVIEIGTGAIPNSAFYGRQQFIVRPGNHLVIVLKGLPNATNITASGAAIQYRDPGAGTPYNPYRKAK